MLAGVAHPSGGRVQEETGDNPPSWVPLRGARRSEFAYIIKNGMWESGGLRRGHDTGGVVTSVAGRATGWREAGYGPPLSLPSLLPGTLHSPHVW